MRGADTLYDVPVFKDEDMRNICSQGRFTITVGDMTTYRYIQITGKVPDVCVFDGRCRDPALPDELEKHVSCTDTVYCCTELLNPHLNEVMYNSILVRKHGMIKIIGEEDLAVIFAKLYAPDDCLILWGNFEKECVYCAYGGAETRAEGFISLRGVKTDYKMED